MNSKPHFSVLRLMCNYFFKTLNGLLLYLILVFIYCFSNVSTLTTAALAALYLSLVYSLLPASFLPFYLSVITNISNSLCFVIHEIYHSTNRAKLFVCLLSHLLFRYWIVVILNLFLFILFNEILSLSKLSIIRNIGRAFNVNRFLKFMLHRTNR